MWRSIHQPHLLPDDTAFNKSKEDALGVLSPSRVQRAPCTLQTHCSRRPRDTWTRQGVLRISLAVRGKASSHTIPRLVPGQTAPPIAPCQTQGPMGPMTVLSLPLLRRASSTRGAITGSASRRSITPFPVRGPQPQRGERSQPRASSESARSVALGKTPKQIRSPNGAGQRPKQSDDRRCLERYLALTGLGTLLNPITQGGLPGASLPWAGLSWPFRPPRSQRPAPSLLPRTSNRDRPPPEEGGLRGDRCNESDHGKIPGLAAVRSTIWLCDAILLLIQFPENPRVQILLQYSQCAKNHSGANHHSSKSIAQGCHRDFRPNRFADS